MIEHVNDTVARRDIPVGHQDTIDENPTVGRGDGQLGSGERRECFRSDNSVIRPFTLDNVAAQESCQGIDAHRFHITKGIVCRHEECVLIAARQQVDKPGLGQWRQRIRSSFDRRAVHP